MSIVPTAANAAAVDDDPVRWSVAPANESGPDGRRVAEHTADPGTRVDDYFAIRNLSDAEVVFGITAADGFFTASGRFDILAGGVESVAAGTWISVPESVTVPAGESVVVPYSIAVPDQTEPGDHAAGITASVMSVRESADGTGVGVESRVGFRVVTRVTGEIAPAAAVGAASGAYSLSWNPVRPGTAEVSFDVTNTGNTRLLAEGTVSVGGRTVTFPAAGESAQELLPGDVRTIVVAVDEVWPWVVVPATITLMPKAVTMAGDDPEVAPVVASAQIWALPVPQLAILLGAVLVAWAIMWRRLRSRRRMSAMIETALAQGREEGRNEMTNRVGAS